MSVGAPRSPNQVLKNQRDNPGRVTKPEQDPQTTRNYAGNIITQENARSRHFRTRKLEEQSCNP